MTKREYEGLLPQHAEDVGSLEQLRKVSPEQLVPLIPSLLLWLKEEEAPMAAGVAELLLPCEFELVPHLRSILKSEFADWKRSIFHHLLPHLPKEVAMDLTSELIALVMNPTESDIDAEVDELSEELLSGLLE